MQLLSGGVEQMEIGGLMSHVFRIFLGNPDVMATILTFSVFLTLALTVSEIQKAKL